MVMVAATRKRNYAQYTADALSGIIDFPSSSQPSLRDASPELVSNIKTEPEETPERDQGQDVARVGRGAQSDDAQSNDAEVNGARGDEAQVGRDLSAQITPDSGSSEDEDEDEDEDEAQVQDTQGLVNSVFESSSVKILIPQNGADREFVIHANIFKDISPRLHSLVQGRKTDELKLDAEDVEGFTHVVKLAYKLATTDSDIFGSKVKRNIVVATRTTAQGLKCGDCGGRGSVVLVRYCKACQNLEDTGTATYGFDKYLTFRLVDHRYSKASRTKHPLDHRFKLPDGAPLVTYARVYAFAVKYGVSDMDAACIRGLHNNMLNADTEAMIELISYLAEYEDELEEWDDLVECVLRGAAGMFLALMKEDTFAAMMKASGTLQFRLMRYLADELVRSHGSGLPDTQ